MSQINGRNSRYWVDFRKRSQSYRESFHPIAKSAALVRDVYLASPTPTPQASATETGDFRLASPPPSSVQRGG